MELVIGQYRPPDWRAELTVRLLAYVMSHGAPVQPAGTPGAGGVARDALDHQCVLVVGNGAVLRDVTWEPVPGLSEPMLVLTEVGGGCGRFSGLEYAAPGTVGAVLGYLTDDTWKPPNQP